MKIGLQNTNSLNFGKKLLSRAQVRNVEGGNSSVDFVEYEPKVAEDREQIRRINVLWQPDSGYLADIANNFLRQMPVFAPHYYGLEDEYGDTLVIAETLDVKKCIGRDFLGKNCVSIKYIQTHPDEQFSSKNRVYKGLGEVLISNIVKKAKKGRKFCVELKSANEGFWIESGYFKHIGHEGGIPVRSLVNKDFDAYISYVENKNGSG